MLDFQCRLKKTLRPMLNFPNRSRVFDQTRRAVRFWGHDSAMEWSFFVTEDALKRLQPSLERNEDSLLLAFDTHRAAIHAMSGSERAPMSLRSQTFEFGLTRCRYENNFLSKRLCGLRPFARRWVH